MRRLASLHFLFNTTSSVWPAVTFAEASSLYVTTWWEETRLQCEYHLVEEESRVESTPEDAPEAVHGLWAGAGNPQGCKDSSRERLREEDIPELIYALWGYEVYKQQRKGFVILRCIGKQGTTFLNHLNLRYATSNCHLRWIPVTEQRQSAFLRAPGMSRTNTQRTTGTFHQPTEPCHFASYDPRQWEAFKNHPNKAYLRVEEALIL